MWPTSNKTPPPAALALIAATLLTACGDKKDTTATMSNSVGDPVSARAESAPPIPAPASGISGLELAADGTVIRRAAPVTEGDTAALDDPFAAAPILEESAFLEGNWSIVLQTFTRGDHRAAARNMRANLPRIEDWLADARVHHTSAGSMVVYGKYPGPDDPRAQADLQRIKSINQNGLGFPRAMLTRLRETGPRSFKRFELLAVRQTYPNIDPLYSLDIALWIADEQGGARALQQAQAAAEAYAKQLRTQGIDAYFHHEPDRRMSNVTVGLFDHSAIDPATSIFSPLVQQYFNRFPRRLVNGESLDVYRDPRQPELGTTKQEPQLVLVPKL